MKNVLHLHHALAAPAQGPICRKAGKGAGPPIEYTGIMSYLNAEKKQEIFGEFSHGKKRADTGSPESQVALFTYRITHLTEHLKNNKHDYGTQRALLRLVGKRRQLLDYLKQVDIERYRAIVKALNLRK